MTHTNIYRFFAATLMASAFLLLTACGASHYSLTKPASALQADVAKCEAKAEAAATDLQKVAKAAWDVIKIIGDISAATTQNKLEKVPGYKPPKLPGTSYIPPRGKTKKAMNEQVFDECMAKAGWKECSDFSSEKQSPEC